MSFICTLFVVYRMRIVSHFGLFRHIENLSSFIASWISPVNNKRVRFVCTWCTVQRSKFETVETRDEYNPLIQQAINGSGVISSQKWHIRWYLFNYLVFFGQVFRRNSILSIWKESRLKFCSIHLCIGYGWCTTGSKSNFTHDAQCTRHIHHLPKRSFPADRHLVIQTREGWWFWSKFRNELIK